ncbi:MAG: ATP-dependent DNA helicase PcrA [Phycisphaerae bacterium]|nr:ATP-dependent DNA helicase PcrA [Phycisphaerae bacterium]
MDAAGASRYTAGMSDSGDDFIFGDLNAAQREAVAHRDGPLLVLAGPGSGKTRVITRRAANLVRQGVPPWAILAITFTNKAADEMRQRIWGLGVERGMSIHTFHALGARLLRTYGEVLGIDPGFSIYDEADQTAVMREAMERCAVGEGLVDCDAALSWVSDAKNLLLSPAEAAQRAERHDGRTMARLYEAYDALLRERGAVDFDDLLLHVAMLLREHADVAEQLNERFQYILIDEYQDTNHAQYMIAHGLSRVRRNICATGDPDQSIYAWRGADLRNILEFERDFPDAVVVRLEQNYRSTGNILRAASSLIAHNRWRKPKRLWTEAGDGPPVHVRGFETGEDEARFVALDIRRAHTAGRPFSDMAVCYRTNALSRALEEAFRREGIRYRIARGVEFYNRREVRDALAYLRVLVNPLDQIALLRIINTPPRGIGKTTVERLVHFAEREGLPLLEALRRCESIESLRSAVPRVRAFVGLLEELKLFAQGTVASALSSVLSLSGLEAALREEAAATQAVEESRLSNVQELVSAAAAYDREAEEPSLADFLRRVALTSDQDAVDASAGCVLLLTLHAAKGLEFPVVYVIGVEDGLLPHERTRSYPDAVEEERRLLFVGMTRARERLTLSHALMRTTRGVPMPRRPSEFVQELGEEGVEQERAAPRTPPRDGWRRGAGDDDYDQRPDDEIGARRLRDGRRTSREAALPSDGVDDGPYADWTAGTVVAHSTYGVGEIVWIRPSFSRTRAGVRFPSVGEKTLILDIAPIRRLG